MKHATWLLALILAALMTAGCGSSGTHDDVHDGRSAMAAHDDNDDGDEDEDEQEIALSAVPANVLAAAQAALPGATFTEAEMETENGAVVYSLEGMKDGAEWEVEVTADGRVLEVERDDENGDGHDDDDDDDDEHDDHDDD